MLTKDACTLHVNFDCDDAAGFGFGFDFGSDNCPSNGTAQLRGGCGSIPQSGVKPENNVALYNGTYVSVKTRCTGAACTRTTLSTRTTAR